jgi:beta-phosphoglucomutase-like phosphatase (HAD superfamily)
MVRQLIREEGRRAHLNIALLEQRHDDAFTKISRDIPVLPGAQELLNFLTRKHIWWAIATTGNKQQTRRLLKKLPITNRCTDRDWRRRCQGKTFS